MRTVAMRLSEGQDLFKEIKKLAVIENIEAGVILSAVGSLKEAKIRVPVIDGKLKYINLSDLEIDSLHGTVSVNGSHLHISVSDIEGKVFGGHIKEDCIIRTTCELVIGVLDDTTFAREPDKETGFDELVLNT